MRVYEITALSALTFGILLACKSGPKVSVSCFARPTALKCKAKKSGASPDTVKACADIDVTCADGSKMVVENVCTVIGGSQMSRHFLHPVPKFKTCRPRSGTGASNFTGTIVKP